MLRMPHATTTMACVSVYVCVHVHVHVHVQWHACVNHAIGCGLTGLRFMCEAAALPMPQALLCRRRCCVCCTTTD
jgi:hypothetical protein